MTPAPVPRRARLAVAGLAVLALVLVGGATAAVQVGASALGVGGGFTVSSPWNGDDHWIGVELENRSSAPITLRAVEVRDAANAEVLDARVIAPPGSHLLMLGSPLPTGIRAAIDRSRPVEGFVLPPHSATRYQIAVRFRPRATGQAVLRGTTVVYSVWGLDHGAVSDGVYCVRAPRRQGCPLP